MLNRTAAAETAAKHLSDVVRIIGSPIVEEHFISEGTWQITLSYNPVGTRLDADAANCGKEYKTFAIDARTGEVLSMRIRSLKG